MTYKVCVVIVTFNRKDYLLKELNALKEQTIPLSKIILIDNNSTDGTEQVLKENEYILNYKFDDVTRNNFENIEFIYYKGSKNLGGSGGFKKGFELALKEDCDYIWAMDDDVCPQSNCLEKLLLGMSDNVGVCVPNRNLDGYIDKAVLEFNWKNPFRPVALKKTKVAEKENMLVKDFAFEGPLFKRNIIENIGIPNSDYFIFFDDSDFAQRCLSITSLLYVVDAMLQKQIIPNLCVENKFSWRSYYVCRNEIVFDRLYNKHKLVACIRPYILLVLRLIKYTLNKNKTARKYSYLAFKDAMKNNLGKTVEPGLF